MSSRVRPLKRIRLLKQEIWLLGKYFGANKHGQYHDQNNHRKGGLFHVYVNLVVNFAAKIKKIPFQYIFFRFSYIGFKYN
jgi:hypothetical protein